MATTGTKIPDGLENRLSGLALLLEDAYDACREEIWAIGRRLAGEPSSRIARTPTVGAYGTDLNLMLAWVSLTRSFVEGSRSILVLCDDPWLYRQLAEIVGVDSKPPPPIVSAALVKLARGFLSRVKLAGMNMVRAIRARKYCRHVGHGRSILLVYGHPESITGGRDAYFGDLMERNPGIRRVLHVDCGLGCADALAADGRTASLHGWGSPIAAFAALTTWWRVGREHYEAEFGWLIRRAIAIENSGAGPAQNRWQMHCQKRWLENTRPAVVVWPWENFAWERELCRTARRLEIATRGYQHTVVGRHQLNFAIFTNPDGADSLPDIVVCNGPAYLKELANWGIPKSRLLEAGAFRVGKIERRLYDPHGPILMFLSPFKSIAIRQIEAARKLAAAGQKILMKEHPMYPLPMNGEANIELTDQPLSRHTALSAVIYSSGTSGLEGVLAGVPSYRFIVDDRIGVDILPEGVDNPRLTIETITDCLDQPADLPNLQWKEFFSDPDYPLWAERILAVGEIRLDC